MNDKYAVKINKDYVVNDANSINCLICENPVTLLEQDYSGYQEPDSYFIYECQNCNTSFSLPIINPNQIYEYIYIKIQKIFLDIIVIMIILIKLKKLKLH